MHGHSKILNTSVSFPLYYCFFLAGWSSIFCLTGPPFQHRGILLIWPSPIGRRFLDIPSVQLRGVPSDARLLPYIWAPVLQLRCCVQTCCIFYSQLVSILSLPLDDNHLPLSLSVEYTGYILPVISMKRWLFWIVNNLFRILLWFFTNYDITQYYINPVAYGEW